MKKALLLLPSLLTAAVLVHCVGDAPSGTPLGSSDGGPSGSDAGTSNTTDGSTMTMMGQDSGGGGGMDAAVVDAAPPVTGAFVRGLALPSGAAWFTDIAVSPSGNDIVAVGILKDTEQIGTYQYTSQTSSLDILVVDFNAANFGVKWVKTYGTAQDERGYGVAFDSAGAIYVSGWISEGAQNAVVAFDTHSFTTAHPGPNGFVAKLDSSGAAQWVVGFDAATASTINSLCTTLSQNPAGGVGVVCSDNGALAYKDVAGNPQTRANAASSLFFAELDPAAGGVKQGTLITSSAAPNVDGLEYDSKGNAYLFGRDTASFTGDTPSFTLTHKGYDYEGFVVKLATGNPHTFAWSQNWGAPATTALTEVHSMAFDKSDNPFVAGGFQTNIDFGGATSLTSAGPSDAFVLALDPANGKTKAQTQLGATGVSLGTTLITFDDVGNIALDARYTGGPFTVAGTKLPATVMDGYDNDLFTKLPPSLGAPIYAYPGVAEDGGVANSLGIQAAALLSIIDGGTIVGGQLSGVIDLGDGTPITRTGEVGYLVQRLR
jgi:hypothetical protein